MLGWIPRGLRRGRVTTRYPRYRVAPPAGFHGPLQLVDGVGAQRELAGVCPTGAIEIDRDGRVSLDRARCIQCGECVRAAPHRFAFAARYEMAARSREALVENGSPPAAGQLHGARRALGEQSSALRRSIHIRHIDTGSDGSEEWEIQALWNPYYDIQRLGFFLTASPRHADILIVTGAVTDPMRGPLERTWEVMPAPKALIAVGTEACSGGLSLATDLTDGGVDTVLPVDVYVPGSPPSPITLLHGLFQAVGLLRRRAAS